MEVIIVLEELNFVWKSEIVEEVKVMWGNGQPLASIAKAVKRSNNETFLLLMDLDIKKK